MVLHVLFIQLHHVRMGPATPGSSAEDPFRARPGRQVSELCHICSVRSKRLATAYSEIGKTV
jgi:hypothetical protein